MKKILSALILTLCAVYGFSQFTVVTDDSTYTPASANALFEVHSKDGNKGILVTRLTTVERTSIVTAGNDDQSLLVYDTDTKTYWYYDGTAWVEISTGGTVTDDQQLTLTNDTLYIEDGNWVYLGGYISNTDDQLLSLSNDTLYIEDGNDVYMGGYMDNTDNQTLSIVGSDITISNGNTITLPAAAPSWLLAGNAGTSVATNFVGTTDNVALAFRTNNTEHVRLTTTGYFGIGITAPVEVLDVVGNVKASGVVYWSTNGSRTETKDDAGAPGGRSGFFETTTPAPATNWPTGATSWWHLLEVRHSNLSNNYALQFAGSFFDQKLYFRKTNNNAAQAWTEVVTTSNYTGGITYDYSNASMTAPNGSMSIIPGMTRTMTLNAGDVVYLHSHGGVMASGINYANVEVAIRVNGADLPNGGYTKVSVDYDVAWQPFANWAVSGHYVVPATGSYTFATYAGRYGGNGDATVGGNNTTVTQGSLRIEVRPGN